MALLKAYRNLDLRPTGVDALGRLTSLEEREILNQFKDVYGEDRTSITMDRIDLALATSVGASPWQVMIAMRARELPMQHRSEDGAKIIGFMIGHLATTEDRQMIPSFAPLKQSIEIKPQVDAMIENAPAILIIDAIMNDSEYPIATMMAFLLRKLQASRFSQCLTFLLWPSTKIDVKLGVQFVKFGYRPYGIMDYEDMPDQFFKNGKCLAMWAGRTRDSREGS